MSETRLFLPAQQDTLASTVVTLRRMRRAAIEGVNPSSQSRDSWVHDTQAYFMQPDAFEDAALLAALAARFMISRGDGNSYAVDHEALKEKLDEDRNRYYHCFPVASYQNPPEAVVRQLDEEVRKLAQFGEREVRKELNKSNGRQPIELQDLLSHRVGVVAPLSGDFLRISTVEEWFERHLDRDGFPLAPVAVTPELNRAAFPPILFPGEIALNEATVYIDMPNSGRTGLALFRLLRQTYPDLIVHAPSSRNNLAK